MHRLLISPREVSGRTIAITAPETLRHLAVLRVRPGEPIECFDGTGRVYRGTVASRQRRRVDVDVAQRRTERPPQPRITLAVALIRPERFEWLIQQATELGTAGLVPVYTARTRSRPSSTRGPGARLMRWRRIAAEAAALSGGAFVPAIGEPRRFDDLVESTDGRSLLLFTPQGDGAWLEELGEGLRTLEALTLLIGPEGDFTPDEVASARARGARLVRLRGRVLRSETAAVAALAVIQHLVERL